MRTAPRSRLALALLAAGTGVVTGCINVSPPGTAFASEPPGARVHIDGQDSGFVTPCQIALDVDNPHVVTVALEGYVTREVRLEPFRRTKIVDWEQGGQGHLSTKRLPLLLPMVDLFFPLRDEWSLAPGHVFVRLHPESAP